MTECALLRASARPDRDGRKGRRRRLGVAKVCDPYMESLGKVAGLQSRRVDTSRFICPDPMGRRPNHFGTLTRDVSIR